MTKTEAIILAGGQGLRMRSSRPKSLQELGGQPMIQSIVDCTRDAGFDRIHIVHGESGYEIRERVPYNNINWVIQPKPLGTGHAVQQVIPHVDLESTVCILYGDIPLIQPSTLNRLLDLANACSLALLTARLNDPTGYGRIKRDQNGSLRKIVEEKDASADERVITEVNAGPVAAKAEPLSRWLNMLESNNAQNEYYLTDVIGHAVSEGVAVATCQAAEAIETQGVNSRIEQARLERKLQMKRAKELMQNGVQIVDPARFDLRGTCRAGKDCRIDVNVILEGDVELADGVQIAASSVIRDSKLGPGVEVRPFSTIEGAEIGEGSTVGPFARIRPGTVIGKNSRVGNYVEVKASTIGDDTKINHHSYIGDAQIGNHVNIGAGVITCNYDGKNKHRTVIGNRVFVGSNVSLVAPIEIEHDANIGAGSTITKKVNAGELAVERSQVRTFKPRKAQKSN